MTIKEVIRKAMDIASLQENEDGSISAMTLKKLDAKKNKLTTPTGRTFVFPSNKVLQDYDAKTMIVYNPIEEYYNGTQTESYTETLKQLMSKYRVMFSEIGMLAIAGANEITDCKEPRLIKFFEELSKIYNRYNLKKAVKEDTRKGFAKLLRTVSGNEDNTDNEALITVVPKRYYKIQEGDTEKEYKVGIVVRFPLYKAMVEALSNEVDEYTINGVKMKRFQLETYIALFKAMLVDADEKFSVYKSNDEHFPMFVATMKAFGDLYKPFLKLYKDLKDVVVGGVHANYEFTVFKDSELEKVSGVVKELKLLPSDMKRSLDGNPAPKEETRVVDSRNDDNAPIVTNRFTREEQPTRVVREDYNPGRVSQPTRVVETEAVDPLTAALLGNRNPMQSSSRNYVYDSEPRYNTGYRSDYVDNRVSVSGMLSNSRPQVSYNHNGVSTSSSRMRMSCMEYDY